MRTGLLTIALVLLGSVAQAQAPTLATLVDGQQRLVDSLLAAVKATKEYKDYQTAAGVLEGLKRLQSAEKPETESK